MVSELGGLDERVSDAMIAKPSTSTPTGGWTSG